MPPGNPVQFGKVKFNSQKEAKVYIKSVLSSIGFCSSVKAADIRNKTHKYNVLMNILQRHPESSKKLANVKDIKIIPNKMNKIDFEINLVKEDDTIEDISYNVCVTGKPKSNRQELLSALRYSIQNQIFDFRNNNNTDFCDLCKKPTDGILHIDHVVEFHKLVDDFHRQTTYLLPTEFEDVKDGTNRCKITNKDKKYEKQFQLYHQKHAILRPLCKHCNLSRNKSSQR